MATNRNDSVETVHLYYYAGGNLIQETKNDTDVTQYVWSAAAPGMMILRDDQFDGFARRVWSMQGPDGSTWALYENGSNGAASVERISYTPTGLATFLAARPVNINAPSGYNFTDLGDFDWRPLWHGGRIARDQDLSIYGGGTVVDRQSGMMFLGNMAYDSTSGRPLLQDKYAFFRPSTQSGELAVNANQFSTRGSVNTEFKHNGSGPTWDQTFWRALGRDPAFQLMLGAAEYVLAPAATFAEELLNRTVMPLYNAITNPVQTFNNVVDSTASFISQGMIDRDTNGWGWGNGAMSAWEGAGYLMGSIIGANSLGEAAYGVDLMGNELSGVDRWSRGFAGAGQMILGGTGLGATYNPTLQSFRMATPRTLQLPTSSATVAATRARVLANIQESQAARAVSKFGQHANFETAYGFYRSGGWSANRTLAHIRGIDFTKSVQVTPLPSGTSAVQHWVPGTPVGNYFAPVGTSASQLGINPAGRVPVLFAVSGDITVLRSTAAPILDTWTVPGVPFRAAGGASSTVCLP